MRLLSLVSNYDGVVATVAFRRQGKVRTPDTATKEFLVLTRAGLSSCSENAQLFVRQERNGMGTKVDKAD